MNLHRCWFSFWQDDLQHVQLKDLIFFTRLIRNLYYFLLPHGLRQTVNWFIYVFYFCFTSTLPLCKDNTIPAYMWDQKSQDLSVAEPESTNTYICWHWVWWRDDWCSVCQLLLPHWMSLKDQSLLLNRSIQWIEFIIVLLFVLSLFSFLFLSFYYLFIFGFWDRVSL